MEQRIQNIIVFLTILFVLGFSVFFFLNPKVKFSANENRFLATIPNYSFEKLKSGKYIQEIETYLTDHFPLRDTFMGLKTSYQIFLNQKEINNVYIGKEQYLFEKYKKPINTQKLIEKLNEFYNKQQDNMNMSLLLVPNSGLINQSKLPKYVSYETQKEIINKIYEQVNFQSIDAIASLQEGSAQYEMYYRLDHHWTSMGAYYAYLAFCQQNNIEPIPIEEYRRVTITTQFEGSLYSKTNIYNYKEDQIDIFLNEYKYKVNYVNTNKITNTLYEDSHLKTKDKYAYFLDGNHPLITIDTEIKNGKQILLIKDSYANSFVPFLIGHYEKIHMIDLRFYNLSVTDYIKDNQIQEVLFLYGMQGIDEDLGIYKIN